jgi:hypothetical protein
VRTGLSVIGFASLFRVLAVFVAGVFVFAVGWLESDEPAGEAWSLFFLLSLVAGGLYGWRRVRGQMPPDARTHRARAE